LTRLRGRASGRDRWVVTSQVIKMNAEEHLAVFGASGAITVALLSGVLLWALGLWDRTPKEVPA
jgi:hypothetical protein